MFFFLPCYSSHIIVTEYVFAATKSPIVGFLTLPLLWQDLSSSQLLSSSRWAADWMNGCSLTCSPNPCGDGSCLQLGTQGLGQQELRLGCEGEGSHFFSARKSFPAAQLKESQHAESGLLEGESDKYIGSYFKKIHHLVFFNNELLLFLSVRGRKV